MQITDLEKRKENLSIHVELKVQSHDIKSRKCLGFSLFQRMPHIFKEIRFS